MLNERRLPASIVLTEQGSGASDHQKKQETPHWHWTRRFSPTPREQNILRSLNMPAQVVQI